MTERAAHLVDHVLPRARVRQWVLSLPFELRYRLAWDHRLCRAVLAVYTRALRGFYRKRAKASGHRGGRTGTVTVIQRFGGALNLNVHFHTLAVDGVFRLGDAPTAKPAPPKGRRQARLGGFDLHANTSVRAKNRPKLERLCRYLLRPPVAEDRLSLAPDGSVLVRLKTPWRDGTSHIALEPLELLEKLAALIPRPYVNPIVYHGVLAPNAKWRREVVDFGRPRLERPSSATTPKKLAAPHNRTWAELMRRGLDIDVLECPDCGARLRFVAAILLSSAIRRILRHLGLPSDPVELAPAAGTPPHDHRVDPRCRRQPSGKRVSDSIWTALQVSERLRVLPQP
jgi:hypothetical protein